MNSMENDARKLYGEATGYLKTLERRLERPSRFSNDLLYGIAAMSFEKLMVSVLAYHKMMALHHVPMALYQEASEVETLPPEAKRTAELLTRFESICSLDGFGYKTPTNETLIDIIKGLVELKVFVGGVVAEVPVS